ncbi:unnamed protein product [Adineta ricciae]|uniref:Uncharacterized protein n=1 Tax=Adineta ricciae TaxID=249248 RepID=A0A814VAV9_ADIRI|nr:unnamed protein product [Adineta ricciae]
MANAMPPLRILLQPRSFYRERYKRETNPRQNRAQRFIHGEANTNGWVYPTIEIPQEWLQKRSLKYFIRVGLVTVPGEQVHHVCVHPYKITSDDPAIISDEATNSLYFPLSVGEFETGRKSFQFCIQKLTHHEIVDHGSLRIFNSENFHAMDTNLRMDAKKIIEFYQLSQSRLFFSLAAFEPECPTALPVTYNISTVYSHVITGTKVSTNDNDACFRYSPQKGDCQGGDEILMFIPQLDRRKRLHIRFEHPAIDQRALVQREFVDEKTIAFLTPPCPERLTRDRPTLTIPIIININDVEINRVYFTYMSLSKCLICDFDLTSSNSTLSTTRKRPYSDFEENTDDDDQFSEKSSNQTNNDYETSTLIRELWTLTESEDPFSVLANHMQQRNPQVLFDLIENTNSFLEQTNLQGETPLLIAAKFNQIELIDRILHKRPELVKQTDKLGNNIFHNIARTAIDAAAKTIEFVLNKLEPETKKSLLEQINTDRQTPKQVAAYHNNEQCLGLLSS